ncbi:MAG: zf-HC2 domain-containing protein [Chloroflexota bacterium]|nr:zf-HC2 domain-containing protein [Chloroflexota bacterium]
MTCSEIVALLPEYIRRRLLATEEAAVRAHLSACPACAAAYEDELAFGAMARGADTPVPPMVLARVMAGVYAEPRQAAAFRVRALDFVLAIGAALAAGGLVIGLLSLWQIRPLVTDLFDPRALLDDGRTLGTITVAALWVVVGLAVSLPIAAMVYAAILRSRRAPLWWSRF